MNNNNILILVTFTVLIILLLIKTINEKENFIVYSSVESQLIKNDNPQNKGNKIKNVSTAIERFRIQKRR